MKRSKLGRFGQAAVLAMMLAAALGAGRARAQIAPPLLNLGSLPAASSTWNFDSADHIGTGPWQSVNVTNTPCFAGPDDPRAGTAHAGAIAWYAELHPVPSQTPHSIYEGDLMPIEGTKASGHVRVVTPQGTRPLTHIDATIWGLEDFALDNLFQVCLQSSQ